MIEGEYAVEPGPLSRLARSPGLRPRPARSVGSVIPTFMVNDGGAHGGPTHDEDDSTLAFRSRMAAWMMLPSALRLMNPGSGTRSSTASW